MICSLGYGEEVIMKNNSINQFHFWCQKVLPLVYDDSLSYYELLCKVVNYLNDVIANVDGLNIEVDKLLGAYNQLQEYVNNYFDNLAVQEEINNKLDQMAQDGTLADIINEILVYKSKEAGWNVESVKEAVTFSQGFVEKFNSEAMMVNDLPIAYMSPILNRMLPMPIIDGSIAGTIDSYKGVLTNANILNNCLAKYSIIMFDKEAGPTGKSLTVRNGMQIEGRRALAPKIPKYNILPKRTEAVAIAESYYNARVNGRKFSYGANFVTYKNNTVVNNGYGEAKMECDTLVALVMMGIPYGLSPYANETNSYNYNFTDIVENPNGYTWALPWKFNTILNRKVTYTGAELWWLWYNKMVYNDFDNIASGDIVIFRKNTSKYFDGITHIGIADVKIENGVNVPYLYHVTGSNKVESPMMYEPLQNVIERGNYDKETEMYFARPNYA